MSEFFFLERKRKEKERKGERTGGNRVVVINHSYNLFQTRRLLPTKGYSTYLTWC